MWHIQRISNKSNYYQNFNLNFFFINFDLYTWANSFVPHGNIYDFETFKIKIHG